MIADYACADEAGGSGLDSCVGTVADGAAINTATLGAKTFSVTATDEAGNDRTVSVSYTVTDQTDPTVTITRPVDGATYARGSSVIAEYACADEAGGSGLDTCVGTVADGAAIDTATLGAKTFSVTATDEAGNDRTVSVGYTVTDQTDPTVTITAPVDGAQIPRNASVLADYACADEAGGSGLDSCVGTVADGAAIATATLGAKTFSVTATDKAGNDRTVSVQYTVVDVTDPVIGITSPTEGQAIPRDTVVAAQYACTDEAGGSGVATCVGTVAGGQPVDTATLGAKTFSVTATDNAGNTDTKTVGYTVVDVTDPVIAITSPTEGQAIARNTVVAAQYACTDEAGGSGVATCVGTVASGQPVDTATLGAKTFSVTATDNAGNTDTKTVGYTVVDVTVPTINAVTPGAGTTYEQGATILADYSCADEPGGSGLASCAGTKPNGQPIDTSGGTHLFTIDAADNAGNLASTTINYIARDRIAPQISIGSPMGSYGLVWILLNPPRAHFACTDNIGGTGMASCTATADGKQREQQRHRPDGPGAPHVQGDGDRPGRQRQHQDDQLHRHAAVARRRGVALLCERRPRERDDPELAQRGGRQAPVLVVVAGDVGDRIERDDLVVAQPALAREPQRLGERAAGPCRLAALRRGPAFGARERARVEVAGVHVARQRAHLGDRGERRVGLGREDEALGLAHADLVREARRTDALQPHPRIGKQCAGALEVAPARREAAEVARREADALRPRRGAEDRERVDEQGLGVRPAALVGP